MWVYGIMTVTKKFEKTNKIKLHKGVIAKEYI